MHEGITIDRIHKLKIQGRRRRVKRRRYVNKKVAMLLRMKGRDPMDQVEGRWRHDSSKTGVDKFKDPEVQKDGVANDVIGKASARAATSVIVVRLQQPGADLELLKSRDEIRSSRAGRKSVPPK